MGSTVARSLIGDVRLLSSEGHFKFKNSGITPETFLSLSLVTKGKTLQMSVCLFLSFIPPSLPCPCFFLEVASYPPNSPDIWYHILLTPKHAPSCLLWEAHHASQYLGGQGLRLGFDILRLPVALQTWSWVTGFLVVTPSLQPSCVEKFNF